MGIQLVDVTFGYAGLSEPVLDRVTADIAPGGVTLVTGRLGAGCSTLLHVIAGLVPRLTGGAISGQVRTLGVDVNATDVRRELAGRIGVLLPSPWTQLSGMSFTVWEEVAFGPANLGRSRDHIGQAVDQSLDLLDIAHLAERDPHTLSGGELQRVMFAAVLAMQPDVLLLDEPLAELDSLNITRVTRLLPKLAQSATVVVAASNIDAVVPIASRVLVLESGKLVADGAPSNVLGSRELVGKGISTTVSHIGWLAGLDDPFPLTVDDMVRRYDR